MNADRKRSAILLAVSMWAGRKREGAVKAPHVLRPGTEDVWRDGYKWAMNEVAQHFNMERLAAELEETDESPHMPLRPTVVRDPYTHSHGDWIIPNEECRFRDCPFGCANHAAQ